MLAPATSFPVTLRNVSGVFTEKHGPPWQSKLRERKTVAHQNGERYERRVSSRLLLPQGWTCAQWFSFLEAGSAQRRWCQVDGFIVDDVRIRICECKIRWCSEAISQLCGLYLPVLSWYFKQRRRTDLYVVTRAIDPSVPGSDLIQRVESLDEEVAPGRIGVLVWK